MSDPNADATPDSVADQIAGLTPGSGAQLPYEMVAMFSDFQCFGLRTSYPYPQGPYDSPALPDHATGVAKVVARYATMADGNTYDLFDLVYTTVKWILNQDPHINDDEPLSVNYRQQP